MQLRMLKEERCQDCYAPTVSDSCRSFHVNGQGFEQREFACGRTIAWIPNFERLEVKALCTRSNEGKERERKREQAKKDVVAYIGDLDVDQDYKTHLKRYL